MRDMIPSIDEVVDILGLQRSPKYQPGAPTYMVKCPFCGEFENKYHMKIDVAHGVYHCYSCGNGQKGTGTLDLYARMRMGTTHRKGSGGNGKEILQALLRDMGRDYDAQSQVVKRKKNRPKPPRIPEASVASDVNLARAYDFILTFPAFKLQQKHRDKLIKRGLDDAAIDRNGYATVPNSFGWLKDYPVYKSIFRQENLAKEARKYYKTKKLSAEMLVAGLVVAAEMEKQGISPKGVPGSFKLGSRWCFILRDGMLIPTRNRKGQAVAIQTRTDKGNVRYLTMSASGLPYAVSKDISRTHFPLANASVGAAREILVTEGPLKADVIAHLYGAPVYLMAIHGVGNTRELPGIFRGLALAGKTRVGNAFDMDKLCNTHVRANSRVLNQIARDAGLSIYQKCWDLDYLPVKYNELRALCIKESVAADLSTPNMLVQVAKMADALYEAQVKFCRKTGPDGKEQTDYWRDETKGLDDYLLFIRQQNQGQKEETVERSA